MVTIETILQQLENGQIERGWRSFVDCYTPLLFQVVREFESDDFGADECFVDLCSRLAENDFARLFQFDQGGRASFETWLRVVATRLCIDWQRSRHGRSRPLRAVRNLAPIEQELFELRFRQGLALHECLLQLNQTHPALTRKAFNDHNAKLNRALTPRQHHALASRARQPEALSEEIGGGRQCPVSVSEPERALMQQQDHERLREALFKLEPLQRLLITLRFSSELSLEDVARMTGLGNAQAARRQLRSAMDDLGALLDS